MILFSGSRYLVPTLVDCRYILFMYQHGVSVTTNILHSIGIQASYTIFQHWRGNINAKYYHCLSILHTMYGNETITFVYQIRTKTAEHFIALCKTMRFLNNILSKSIYVSQFENVGVLFFLLHSGVMNRQPTQPMVQYQIEFRNLRQIKRVYSDELNFKSSISRVCCW